MLPMLPEHKKKLIHTLIAAFVVGLIMAMPGSGFMIGVAILVLIVWIPIRVIGAIRKPEIRRLRVAQISVWILAILIVFAIQQFNAAAARQSADEIAAKVEAFSARNGRCPETLQEVGISESERRGRPGRPMYACEDGRPILIYYDTMLPFGRYSYSFTNHAWNLHPD